MRSLEFVLNVQCGERLGGRRTHMLGRKELKEDVRIRKLDEFCFSCTNGHLWYYCLLSLRYRHLPSTHLQFVNIGECKALYRMRREMRRYAALQFTKLPVGDSKTSSLFFCFVLNMLLWTAVILFQTLFL